MKVLILAAGYGTRLKEITKDTPKPLLPINDQPLINYIIDKLKGLKDLNEFIVVTNSKFFDHFQKWADDQKTIIKPITVVSDGTTSPENRLGSIGDIDFVIKTQKITDDLLVVGGDNLFDYNVDEYIIKAQSERESATIGLFDIDNFKEASLFGVVEVDRTGKVISFEEKPANPRSTLISMCFYYFPSKTLGTIGEYLSESDKSDKAGDFIRWLSEKYDAYGFKFSGKWYDIGSIEAYEDAKANFKIN